MWIWVAALLLCQGVDWGQVARREKARRASLPQARTLELPRPGQGAVTTGKLPPSPKGPDRPREDSSDRWYRRMGEARRRVAALERQLRDVERELQKARRQPPSGRRGASRTLGLEGRRSKVLERLEEARERVHQVEEDARRAGVLPGWLRGQRF